jgi:hypothetical protein
VRADVTGGSAALQTWVVLGPGHPSDRCRLTPCQGAFKPACSGEVEVGLEGLASVELQEKRVAAFSGGGPVVDVDSSKQVCAMINASVDAI